MHNIGGGGMDVRKFVLAGNAVFTLRNLDTGNRVTYKVVKPRGDSPHFVRVLTGPDNEGDYSFLGTIFDETRYRYGRKSRIGRDAMSARVFEWAWPRMMTDTLPEQVEFYHEGQCGRCGRRLTVPESIESGFGPECIKYIS